MASRRRLLQAVLVTPVTFALLVLVAMLLGWRFGPVVVKGGHEHFDFEITGTIVDAESGEPIVGAWVSDNPMALEAGDTDGREFIARLIRRIGRSPPELPSVYGAFAVEASEGGSFQIEGFGFWDYEEPAYGIRLGPDPRPSVLAAVQTLIVEAAGYERRAVSLRGRRSETETPPEGSQGSLFLRMDVGRLELRKRTP